MKLHPNYKKALEKRYSKYSLDEFVKKAKNSHLYSQHKNYYNAFIFDGEPKETIVKDEYDENYIGYKYEGKIKEEFQIIKYCYYFDNAIDISPEGEKIILDTFSLMSKYPDKDYYDLFHNKVYEDQDNESKEVDKSEVVQKNPSNKKVPRTGARRGRRGRGTSATFWIR